MKNSQLVKDQQGVTFFELIVYMVVLGVFVTVAYGIMVTQARTINTVFSNTEARWELRKTLSMLRADFQELDSSNLNNIRRNRINFRDSNNRRIQYRLNGSNFYRKVRGQDWQLLLENVQSRPFVYYDSDMAPVTGNGHAARESVAYIEVNFSIQSNNVSINMSDIFYVRN
ncbi:MAG: hypothetical protein GF313_02590 [Caldithrix sp.]|nr:hypothetical protein [Caldithrix sp.]